MFAQRQGLDIKSMKSKIKHLAGQTLYRTHLYRAFMANAAVVVAFHRVSTPALDGLTCDVEMFKRYSEFFAKYLNVVPLSDLIHKLEKGLPLDRELAITFDDGYQDNYLNAAPILKSMGLPATFFIATTFIGTDFVPWWDRKLSIRHPWMTWEQVADLHRQGFQIGAHTRTHADLGVISGEVAWEEIHGSRMDLEEKLSATINLFAYPYGRERQITEGNRDLVRKAGFHCSCSCYGGINRRGKNPFFLRRIPVGANYPSPYDFGFDLAFNRTEGTY